MMRSAGDLLRTLTVTVAMSLATHLRPAMQLFNPYGHDNLFTYLNTNDAEWKACRKAFAKSMSPESIRYVSLA